MYSPRVGGVWPAVKCREHSSPSLPLWAVDHMTSCDPVADSTSDSHAWIEVEIHVYTQFICSYSKQLMLFFWWVLFFLFLSCRSSNIFLSRRGCFYYFVCVCFWLGIYLFMVLSFPLFLFLSSPFPFLVCYKRELSCTCIHIIRSA